MLQTPYDEYKGAGYTVSVDPHYKLFFDRRCSIPLRGRAIRRLQQELTDAKRSELLAECAHLNGVTTCMYSYTLPIHETLLEVPCEFIFETDLNTDPQTGDTVFCLTLYEVNQPPC